MKTKLLALLAILLFAATGIHAQIAQGKYLLGGSIAYNNTKNNANGPTSQEYFGSYIQFGKVFKENNVSGIILSYRYSGYPNTTVLNTSRAYGGGIFYRKYKPLTKALYFFGEVDGIYTYTKNEDGKFGPGNDARRFTGSGVRVALVPGLSFAVFKKLQMELSMPNLAAIEYNWGKTETTSALSNDIVTADSHNFTANVRLNQSLMNDFAIGFKFLLGK